MQRSGIVTLLRIVVLVAALALPAAVLPQAASAGWTWDDAVPSATSADGSGEATTGDGAASADGWTWDESAAPDDEATSDGWTWDESPATGSDPAPADGGSTDPATPQPAP